jgi:hypothetical protein
MTSTSEIISTVDQTVPLYELSLIDPAVVGETRTANCFALAAVVGAAMLSREVAAEDELFLLISNAHGLDTAHGNRWLGHVGVIFAPKDGREGMLIEVVLTPEGPRIGQRLATSILPPEWVRGVQPQDQPIIYRPAMIMGARSADERSQIINATRHYYTAFPFSRAVVAYQRVLERGGEFTVPQYGELYDRLEHSLLSGEPQPQRFGSLIEGTDADSALGDRIDDIVRRAFGQVWGDTP